MNLDIFKNFLTNFVQDTQETLANLERKAGSSGCFHVCSSFLSRFSACSTPSLEIVNRGTCSQSMTLIMYMPIVTAHAVY